MLYEGEFQSVNKRDNVQYWLYVPAAQPKGVIQLVHGFGEHARRYLLMIAAYVKAGYIVAADDHVGHGKTAIVNNSWGDWGDAGFETMVNDEYELMKIAKAKFPDVPYYMFGHSMGSVITREFIARYGNELKAAALCGTCGSFPTKEAEAMLEKDVAEGKGKETDVQAAGTAMGWMGERCGEIKLGNEWICHDHDVQVDHANDPFDAFTRPTTNQSLLYFMQMIDDVTGVQWAKKVPKALPLYSIAGDQDPFGNYGQGVYEVSNWLYDTGHQITTKVYSGYRHEIHNYKDIQDEVVDGIIQFFEQA
ncbi:alpha/beta fold hydrolase [Catenisphaera adipataccumulans]|uniref:Alpha-beta hydrolase superfamily lysophospholipase n=1 Tax=Catenisphaera adipataccumulans TaxID=700500 RepID=A0A7W8CXH1_9FIRM|nr:alpha/beta fold hydrolase [Catenisphaera adipataccumulans]MBB5183136.1 alpha-beta hydrolase superfamily lysophospholipase [Catenisphaera adipataccumulans]